MQLCNFLYMQEVIPSGGDVVIVLHMVDSPHGSQLCCMESQRRYMLSCVELDRC